MDFTIIGPAYKRCGISLQFYSITVLLRVRFLRSFALCRGFFIYMFSRTCQAKIRSDLAVESTKTRGH